MHTLRFPWRECLTLAFACLCVLVLWFLPSAWPLPLAPTLVSPTFRLAVVWACWRLAVLDRLLRQRRPWLSGGVWTVRVDRLARALPAEETSLCFGQAFRWLAQHTQQLEHLLAHDGALPVDQRGPRGGTAALHAVGQAEEAPLVLPHPVLTGQTVVTGKPGSGKSVLFALLARLAIRRRGCVVVLDAKKDDDLFAQAQDEAQRMGKRFVCFTPAFLSSSISLNVLSTATTPDEVASRIKVLMPSGGGHNADPIFEEYCLTILTKIAAAQHALGDVWTLEGLYVAATIRERMKVLVQRYLACLGIPLDPKHNITEDIKAYDKAQLHDLLADELIKLWRHEPEHYQKMTATMDPTFRGLIGHPYGPLFSPQPGGLTWQQIAEEQMVLYISLPALLLKDTGNRMARALIQDLLGYAGRLYVYGDARHALPMTLLVDELRQVLSHDFLNALAMTRGAQWRWILGQQSMADMEEVLGPAAARVMLDSCTTRVYFQLADYETAEQASKTLDECLVAHTTTDPGIGYGGVGGLTGTLRQQTRVTQQTHVRPGWFATLPKGEYFARVDGVAYKGRVPLLAMPPVPEIAAREAAGELVRSEPLRLLTAPEEHDDVETTDGPELEPLSDLVLRDGDEDRPAAPGGD